MLCQGLRHSIFHKNFCYRCLFYDFCIVVPVQKHLIFPNIIFPLSNKELNITEMFCQYVSKEKKKSSACKKKGLQ